MPHQVVKIRAFEWYGETAVNIVYELPDGGVRDGIFYEDQIAEMELVEEGQFWTFDADGDHLKLAIEAQRIRLAHHFDPYLAIHTSLIRPLPHQITAVYEEMLSRQPLRFLLADDPGAGKTIMAGLLVKELLARGEIERCLVVAPGILVEQWQDELGEKFGLEFDLLTRDMVETSRTGNPFNDKNFLIARLDMLARDEELQERLRASDEWDLIICDEAHRMSATLSGKDIRRTKRYDVGQLCGDIARYLLLMTATPHNGKEADFQLFMALLDGDRFEGRFREGVDKADAIDMMRRLTKEELLTFEGTKLFPERHAHTVTYSLSDEEEALYEAVTDYVRNEWNRVQRMEESGGKRKTAVGFALQILQRRLASSPAAIYKSLNRRKERLQQDLVEFQEATRAHRQGPRHSYGFIDEIEEGLDDNEAFLEGEDDENLTFASTADTAEQLETEIGMLKDLEAMALRVLRSGNDTKWTELKKILDDQRILDADGVGRKLIIFTEARDTLEYIAERVSERLGRPNAVDVIHGGVARERRREVIHRFMQDRELLVLVANDAAGEGVNLQRGHLMVNYDLPWNPNRLEQRFGRIHRIGQTEVCHLWNMVAVNTREGLVYQRLLEKLERAREALGGQVYDVLGDLLEGVSLRDLLWDAVQEGEKDEVRNRQFEQIDGAVDLDHIHEVVRTRKLTTDAMPESQVQEIRLDMERAEAERLQPHHIHSFFMEAFQSLKGKIVAREPGRFEISRVPMQIVDWNKNNRHGKRIRRDYQRVCFDKQYVDQQPVAEFISPGHPLLDAVIELIYEQHSGLMKLGAVMVDESDFGTEPRAAFLIEHAIQDGRTTSNGNPLTISQKLQFASVDEAGQVISEGMAPHLNLRKPTDAEEAFLAHALNRDWLTANLEKAVQSYAIRYLARQHFDAVTNRRKPEIDKVEQEVRSRLAKEINYWDKQAYRLRLEERAGKQTRLPAEQAETRAKILGHRLEARLALLARERAITSSSPVITGGLVIVPRGMLAGQEPAGSPGHFAADPLHRAAVEQLAMKAVMEAERTLGNRPTDVSHEKVGYDIRSLNPGTNKERFIEVKGRIPDADIVTVTRNEIITSLNKPDDYILALVPVENGFAHQPRYVRRPFELEPEFSTHSVNVKLAMLMERSEAPG